MAKKRIIGITETKAVQAGFKIFDISLHRSFLGVTFFTTFDLEAFSQAGYLVRLVDNFKEPDKACYILFTSFGGVQGASETNIDRVLSLTTSYLALEPILPEKWSDKLFFSCPNPVYFLILRQGLENISKIVEYISSIETRCDFIFDSETNKERLFAKIKDLHSKKKLSQEDIFALGLEVIGLRFAQYAAEDQFRIFSQRFDRQQIAQLILSSVERDKFEVA